MQLSTKRRLYVGGVLARVAGKSGFDVFCVPIALSAFSYAEAKEHALRDAQTAFPGCDGWYAHDSTLVCIRQEAVGEYADDWAIVRDLDGEVESVC